MLALTHQLLTSSENSVIEVNQFYSSTCGVCQQYLSAEVTMYVWILFVFCENVYVISGEQSLSELNH